MEKASVKEIINGFNDTKYITPRGAGKIVEAGSNENGSWIKFANGAMICRINTTRKDIGITQAYGSIYLGHYTWVYPQPFKNADVSVCCSQFLWGTSASWGSALSPGSHNVLLRAYDYYSRAAGTETNICAIAVGWWK